MSGSAAREFISADDRTQLATDVGPVPMNVGAILRLAAAGPIDPRALAAVVGERVGEVPRLAQRLVRRPGARPYWEPDPTFDPSDHIVHLTCPSPGDQPALLDVGIDVVTQALPRSAPLWRVVVVDGLDSGDVALVVVLHHVLADGVGGLAVLERLADPGEPAPRPQEPTGAGEPDRPQPPTARPQPRAARIRRGWAELGSFGNGGAPRTSFNRPTGPRRRLATTEVSLKALRDAARARGATVNDALLVAVTGAIGRVLSDRGETVTDLVVSVPVSARRSTTSGELGNRVGVMPVRVSLDGTAPERLVRVSARTRVQKSGARGASAALVGPAFRLISAAGLFRWAVNRQRLVNSFLTNLRGPAGPVFLGGHLVTRIVPVTITAGNVGVAFAAFSYAGTLGVTVIADPDVVPEYDAVAAAVAAELTALTVAEAPAGRGPAPRAEAPPRTR